MGIDREQLAIIRQGAGAWNNWREQNQALRPSLGLARLNNLSLTRVNLRDADLHGANFRGADLRQAKLFEADLRRANFLEANLREADLRGADLRGADLSGADLTAADLRRTELRGAILNATNLTNACAATTGFGYVDLSEAKGLETMLHMAPSTIGVDTLYLSQGKIHEQFLRGVGVPENLLTYVRSLVNRPIDFYSCFISYSSRDEEFSERLHADLQAKGVRCWFAPEDLKIGDRFQDRIEESIRMFERVIIVLSDASVGSDWVRREVDAAMERERREKHTLLFPIRIDDAVLETTQAWAADIRRTRHIGDFRCWKTHETYMRSMARLLRDLEASDDGAARQST